jgi:hypothetical protein
MQRVRNFARSFVFALLLGLGSAPAWSLDLNTKAGLQAAMESYIDQQLVNGMFLYLDTKKGEVLALHPVTAHPMIFTMGPHFVLCFDFRDAQGKDVNLDLYMARKGNSYVVFRTEVDNPQLLQKLMDAGKVSTTD